MEVMETMAVMGTMEIIEILEVIETLEVMEVMGTMDTRIQFPCRCINLMWKHLVSAAVAPPVLLVLHFQRPPRHFTPINPRPPPTSRP